MVARGQAEREQLVVLLADDEHRTVLALRRVVLVGHPGPHDLAGIGPAVGLGRVAERRAGITGRTARMRGSRNRIAGHLRASRSWCAGPGAPHGAWPLEAALFGTRGCRGPAQARLYKPLPRFAAESRQPNAPVSSRWAARSSWSARVSRREADTSEAYDDASERRFGVAVHPSRRCHPGERRGPEQRVGEVADHHAAEHLVDQRTDLVGAGWLDHAGDRPRRPARGAGRGRTPPRRSAGRRTPSCAAGTAARPRRPASRPLRRTTARRASRDPRSRPGAPPARRGPASAWSRAPRTSAVAARSAASLSIAGSTLPSIDSKCWAPGSRGRW